MLYPEPLVTLPAMKPRLPAYYLLKGNLASTFHYQMRTYGEPTRMMQKYKRFTMLK